MVLQLIFLLLAKGRFPHVRVFTTQGDPLAMSLYALAMVLSIRKLHSTVPNASQVWFVDDATVFLICWNGGIIRFL